MEKIKKIIRPENFLAVFIIICPILDITSFLFRNKFQTNFSISTFLRPIIPGIVFIYLFFKQKDKGKISILCAIYFIYAVMHLLLYKNMMTKCSFGTIIFSKLFFYDIEFVYF